MMYEKKRWQTKKRKGEETLVVSKKAPRVPCSLRIAHDLGKSDSLLLAFTTPITVFGGPLANFNQ